jgi:hypothetical protein
MNTVFIDESTVKKDVLQDECNMIKNILNDIEDDTILSFKKGTYNFYPLLCNERYLYVTNNDHGLQKCAFYIENKNNITIDGNGSFFIFHGRVSPFFVHNSTNIKIKNLSIDYKRAMFSQGEIVDSDESSVTIKIDREEYPFRIAKDGHIIFTGDNYESDWSWGMMEFDKEKCAPIDGAIDYFIKDRMYGIDLGQNKLKIFYDFEKVPSKTNILIIKHEMRLIQAITLDRSSDIEIDSVIIHHSGSMAITAQFCENLIINKVMVTPSKNRLVSANADAVHCVGCRGLIDIENCLFENQMDDALNVHSNYLIVDKVLDCTTVLAKIGHFQHFGIFDFKIGSNIEISDRNTFEVKFKTRIKGFNIINNQFIILKFSDIFNYKNDVDYCIDNIDSYPSLIFKNNIVRRNRARGILLKTERDVLIESNQIHATGAAIKICSDMNFWFESGRSKNITIKKNIISGKRTSVWGCAIIDIDPEIPTIKENFYYIKDITIDSNNIILNNAPFVFGRSIYNLNVINNVFSVFDLDKINSYETLPLELSHTKTLKGEGNTFKKIDCPFDE